MKVSDFDYYLPEELIAQTPLEKRDSSRLLVLDKKTGEIEHKRFYDIISYLKKGDTLVLNDTKVLPARLIGVKEETNAVIEILLLKNLEGDKWECLVKPARRIKEGTIVSFGDGKLKAKCCGVFDDGIRHFELIYSGILLEILEKLESGKIDLVIGTHFTQELLDKIKAKGINIVYVTLHVGLGTFRPVAVEKVEEHEMHSEFYTMSSEVANILNNTKNSGGRIIAVGTTSTRTLETIMGLYGEFRGCSGWTNIFIYPGYKFKGIDGLITNFHLPKSTLVMLVSTLAGRGNILNAYKIAVEKKYRFFSFGDAMFIK